MKEKKKKKLGVVALKHKMVLDNLSKKIGKDGKNTFTQAMIDAGYSKTYAESGEIKKKKTWQQLMEIYLPDDLLAEKHYQLLHAKELDYFVFPKSMKDEEIEERMAEAGTKLIVVRNSDKGKMAFYAKPNSRHKPSIGAESSQRYCVCIPIESSSGTGKSVASVLNKLRSIPEREKSN